MNIGIFSYDSYPFIGGQGRNLLTITNHFSKEGNIFLFSPSESIVKNSIKIFPFSKKVGQNLTFSFFLNLKVTKYIRDFKLDKVVFQCGPGGLLMYRKIPVTQISVANHTYYQQSNYLINQKWKRIFIPIEKIAYLNSQQIISISKSTADILVAKYNVVRKRIKVVNPKIDSNRFYPIKNNTEESHSMLYVGRLDKRKGVDILLRAFSLAAKHEPKLKLYVVGKGKLIKWIDKFCIESNITSKVKTMGFVSDRELLTLYNKVSIVIIPSVFEGFGITVIEAMACKKAVIGTKVDGIKDIIKHNKNGLLVKYSDVYSLKNSMIKLIENRNLRKRLGNNAYQTILRQYLQRNDKDLF